MDPQRWKEIQRLFEEALDLGPAAISDFLDITCGDDAELKKEVLSLLAADAADNDLLDNNADDILNASLQEYNPGDAIGPYRIVRLIGSGGMGMVYLAERADGEFSQQVALKIIRRGMNSEEILRRFKAERQILAGLNHPNIARLFDGGITAGGLPYFTLEYIEGHPIDYHCDENKLSLEKRLELFLTVCDAVEYAQRNLIVHRDLKPGNILVTTASEIKLLDFGIAKLLSGGDQTEMYADMTKTGVRMMTPRYASPEQILGKSVTTASDVYSLGVILFELLSGSQPYGVSGDTPAEIEEAICTTAPQKPSLSIGRVFDSGRAIVSLSALETVSLRRDTTPSRLRRRLAGDLDNICLQALRKEPERRYQSADQLARDIRLHLEGRPISARPDSAVYVSAKFLRRHYIGVAMIVLLLAVAASLTTFYTINLKKERDKARRESARATQVSNFLIELFQSADPNETKGDEITARELLANGAKRIETELADEPDIQATMMVTIGQVYQQLGQYENALPFIDKALTLRLMLFGETNEDVADIYNEMGTLMYNLGHYDSSEACYRRAYRIDKSLFGEAHPRVSDDLNDIATALRVSGQDEKAENILRQCLDVRLKLYGENNLDVAHTLNHLGRLLVLRGEFAEAEGYLRRGLKIRRDILGDDNVEVVASIGTLAGLLSSMGEYQQAADLYRAGLATVRKLFGNEHNYVGGMANSLANVLREAGQYEEAEQLCYESLDILRRTLPAGHANVAYPLTALGTLLIETGRSAEALPYLEESLAIRKEAFASDHWQVGISESTLGYALIETGDYDEAEAHLLEGYHDIEKQYGNDNGMTQKAIKRIIELYEKWDKPDMAREFILLINNE